MKTIVTVLALSLSSIASENVVLTCTTPGDALDAVEFVETEQGNEVRISQMDESVTAYKSKRSFKFIKAKESDTIIANGEDSIAFGGMESDSILIRIFSGATSGRMASRGSVFYLNCR